MSDGKILENDVPVFLVQFSTQEVLMFRNAKTGEISVGADNKVEQCTYIAAITRVEEELTNELTGGWKVIEVCGFHRDFYFCLLIELLDGTEECSGISLKVIFDYLYYLLIGTGHNNHYSPSGWAT